MNKVGYNSKTILYWLLEGTYIDTHLQQTHVNLLKNIKAVLGYFLKIYLPHECFNSNLRRKLKKKKEEKKKK